MLKSAKPTHKDPPPVSSLNVANTITVSRVGLALVAIGLLWLPDEAMRWTSFVLTGLVIWADGLDGYFARKLNQSSKFGGILDIAGDRAVEMCYWIAFCALGWIPVWIPLVYVVRGTFVDAIRSFASEQGYTAFGSKTMMQSAFGKLLVTSNFSRFTYAVTKAAAFCLLILAHTSFAAQYPLIGSLAILSTYIATGFCIVRGLPVLLESGHLFRQ